MVKKLFVGSLPYEATNSQLEELFTQFGKIDSVNVIIDKFTGQGKGFGFVEMSSEEDAKKAITSLNGSEFMGRKLIVNEARPQEDRTRGFSDTNRRGGGFQRQKRW